MSIEPWNTAAGGRAACEDMPRKSIDKKLTDNPVQQKRGRLRPFPAIRRGRVRAEPANGSRDESLVGFGATPQGLKNTNICNFRGSFEPIFLTQFFHRLFDTTYQPFLTIAFLPFFAFLTGTFPFAVNTKTAVIINTAIILNRQINTFQCTAGS